MKRQGRGNPDRWIFLSFGLLLLVGIVMLALIRNDALEFAAIAIKDRTLPAPLMEEPGADDIPVRLGAYIENLYDFSPDDKSFGATGVIWLKWTEPVEAVFKAQGIPIEKWLDFVNLIDGWDFKLEAVHERPLQKTDGESLQSFRFHGHFYANDLDFHEFPFQFIKLPLTFELTNETPGSAPTKNLFLTPDERNSGVGAYIDILGYKTTGFDIRAYRHQYATNFGLDGHAPKQSRQIAFETTYRQSVNASLLTLFLPLTVVMALVLFSPMLSASLWDVRLGIPPTALLALIFLQQGYKNDLPDLPYATYMDMAYNICYLVNLVLFGLFLWSSNQLHRASAKDKPAIIAHITRVDARFQVGLTLMLAILLAVDWLIVDALH
jgi:hypothetical protein